MAIRTRATHNSPPAHWNANLVSANHPVSIGSRLTRGPPDGILINRRENVAFKQIELRMRSVKVKSTNDYIGRAAVELSHRVVIGNHIPCGPQLQHNGFVSALDDVVLN